MRFRPARLAQVGAVVFALSTVVSGQDTGRPYPSHVRGTTADSALLLQELVARSATGRDLIDHLEQSDLLIYVRFEFFTTTTLRGRIGLIAANGPRRVLAIEIDSRHTRTDQLVALGHELRHAVEIAGAPSVSDPASLAALYTAIGEQTGFSSGYETYETIAAADAGRRVRVELSSATADAAGPRD